MLRKLFGRGGGPAEDPEGRYLEMPPHGAIVVVDLVGGARASAGDVVASRMNKFADRPTSFVGFLIDFGDRDYRFSSITEEQLEAGFHAWMPNKSPACSARLDQFFTQWFDTAYPHGGSTNRPQLTGPDLDGPGLYNADGTCG